MVLVTAAQGEAAQRRAAGGLRALGARPGDRVVLPVDNHPEVLAAVLGALRTGIVPVLLNAGLLATERAALVADAEPALVLDEAGLRALFDAAAVELSPAPLARPMHYTSGTSGRPKGVWSGLLSAEHADALAAEERDLWGFSADDVHLVAAPLYHSAPLRFAAGTWLAGGSVAVLTSYSPTGFVAATAALGPTTTFLSPAHLQRLLSEDRPVERPLDTASFRLLAHAGAPCPPRLKERVLDAFPDGSVWEFYGSTEGQFTACSPQEWLEHPGTVGRARPGRALRVDEHRVVWCRVPPHARFTYWRDPAKTAAAWSSGSDGDWFTVGDLGRLDAEGYLWLDGRRDDLIISGGVNVYPLEIERVLSGLPGVHEVVVYGVDDEQWGQRVCAAVVGTVTPEAVSAWARVKLAPYKQPKQVRVVAEIPASPTGKVRRSTLGSLFD